MRAARSRHRAIWLWLVLGTLGCTPMGPASSQAAGNELVQNGGFESDGSPAPAGWLLEDKVASKGKVRTQAAVRQSGEAALELLPNAQNAGSNSPLGIGQVIPADVIGGKTVTVSARMAAKGSANAVTALLVLRKDGKIEHVRLDQGSGGMGMALRQGSLDVPPANDIQLIVLTCGVEGTDGAAYFDDVSLRIGAPEPKAADGAPPTPAGTAGSNAGAGVLRAQIAVDASRTLRTIPRTLYGTNVEWAFDGNAIWDAKLGALEPDVVRLTRELGLSLIRFPGGFFADYYHWKDGIGPRASRKTTEHHPKGPKSVHNFGTDEALSLAEQTNTKLLFIANVVTGTPEEAAEWVRYAKQKREAGEPAVTHWEVGNESYIDDGGPISKAGTLTPEEYAKRFLAFARAMRAADPTIKVGAIGGENQGRYRMVHYANWDRTVLQAAGAEMDFLAVHNAYAPVYVPDPKLDVRTVYAAMMGAPVLIGRNLAGIDQQIKSFAAKPDAVSIAVTEWGPLFGVETKSPYIDHVKTLGSALLAASILKTFIESPRTDIANFFKLVDSLFMGWIGLRDGRYVPTALYYMMQLYTQHFGSTLVASKTTSPTFDAPGIGLVDAVPDVPYLDVVASRSQDGSRLFVLAINKHFGSAITAKLDFSGFTPTGEGVARTLSGTGIDANTGTAMKRYPGMAFGEPRVADTDPRFLRGGPMEVKLESKPVPGVSGSFEYTFPPHSVTSLELR